MINKLRGPTAWRSGNPGHADPGWDAWADPVCTPSRPCSGAFCCRANIPPCRGNTLTNDCRDEEEGDARSSYGHPDRGPGLRVLRTQAVYGAPCPCLPSSLHPMHHALRPLPVLGVSSGTENSFPFHRPCWRACGANFPKVYRSRSRKSGLLRRREARPPCGTSCKLMLHTPYLWFHAGPLAN